VTIMISNAHVKIRVTDCLKPNTIICSFIEMNLLYQNCWNNSAETSR